MLSEAEIQALAATRTIDITTIGRRSGRPARIEICWFHLDGEFMTRSCRGTARSASSTSW